MKFSELKINDLIKKALVELKYETPSPIQEQAIPVLLEGRDVLGCAQTGTGKTCAFMVPIIDSILKKPNKPGIKALVLTPTRELAIQIYDNTKAYAKYTNVKSTVIYGGVKEGSQKTALKAGVDILIATPGRLLDFIGQGICDIRHINFFVLDEADRMLDMGFIHDVKRVINIIPKVRQTLLFSATMPDSIMSLCNAILTDPVKIEVTPPSTTVEAIDQSIYFVDKENKTSLLLDLLRNNGIYTALVFCKTKHGADKISKTLQMNGIQCDSIHGNKSQNARQRALKDFKAARIQALIATDIAARGIDINELSHVINYDLPDTPETYVHRIGRTARAGHDGVAYTFVSAPERDMLRQIEKTIKMQINVVEDHKYPMKDFNALPEKKEKTKRFGNRNTPKKNFSSKSESVKKTDNKKKDFKASKPSNYKTDFKKDYKKSYNNKNSNINK